jgi:hypothetical protein
MRFDLVETDDVAAIVRSAAAESIVLVLAADWPPLVLARLRASVAPLAIERAPDTRVNAVILGEGAGAAAVDAAIAFLESARSTTGQVLEIS